MRPGRGEETSCVYYGALRPGLAHEHHVLGDRERALFIGSGTDEDCITGGGSRYGRSHGRVVRWNAPDAARGCGGAAGSHTDIAGGAIGDIPHVRPVGTVRAYETIAGRCRSEIVEGYRKVVGRIGDLHDDVDVIRGTHFDGSRELYRMIAVSVNGDILLAGQGRPQERGAVEAVVYVNIHVRGCIRSPEFHPLYAHWLIRHVLGQGPGRGVLKPQRQRSHEAGLVMEEHHAVGVIGLPIVDCGGIGADLRRPISYIEEAVVSPVITPGVLDDPGTLAAGMRERIVPAHNHDRVVEVAGPFPVERVGTVVACEFAGPAQTVGGYHGDEHGSVIVHVVFELRRSRHVISRDLQPPGESEVEGACVLAVPVAGVVGVAGLQRHTLLGKETGHHGCIPAVTAPDAGIECPPVALLDTVLGEVPYGSAVYENGRLEIAERGEGVTGTATALIVHAGYDILLPPVEAHGKRSKRPACPRS